MMNMQSRKGNEHGRRDDFNFMICECDERLRCDKI